MTRNARRAERCVDRIDKLADRLRDDWWHLTEDEVQTFAEVICQHPDELLAALVSVGILEVPHGLRAADVYVRC